jgi:hypothetical protein
MLWKLFQLTIMAAVMCGNIYYDLTPNPYLVGLLGLGTAFVATWLLVRIGTLFSRRGPELRYDATSHHKSTVGARWDTNNLTEGIPTPWVRKNASDLIQVAPEAPCLERIIGEAHPFPGARTLGGDVHQPRIGHGRDFKRIERG